MLARYASLKDIISHQSIWRKLQLQKNYFHLKFSLSSSLSINLPFCHTHLNAPYRSLAFYSSTVACSLCCLLEPLEVSPQLSLSNHSRHAILCCDTEPLARPTERKAKLWMTVLVLLFPAIVVIKKNFLPSLCTIMSLKSLVSKSFFGSIHNSTTF